MQANHYVLMTIQLFRVQALAAKAAGDADRAEAFEAAIRSLLEDTGFEREPVRDGVHARRPRARRPLAAPN